MMLLVILAIVAVACGDAAPDADTGTPLVGVAGDLAPSRAFELFDGSEVVLADYRGSPVVLNFWASWCPSCVAEMSAAFRPVEELVGDQVTFIGVNIQDVRELAERLLDDTGVQWINATDPDGALYVDLGGLGMPFTVFIDPAGNVVEEHNGPLNEQQLADRIAELFGVAA